MRVVATAARRMQLVILAVGVVLTGQGCRRAAATGEVTGKVTVGGSSVQFGTIAFVSKQGRVATGTIQNGSFRTTNIPTGSTTVTVQAVRLGTPVGHPTLGPLPGTSDAAPFVAVPARYGSVSTSPLTLDVAVGLQQKDFDLEAK